MKQALIDKINSFKTFTFDLKSNKIKNNRFQEDTNIDEFLAIQNLLDQGRVLYSFDKNFEIELISVPSKKSEGSQ